MIPIIVAAKFAAFVWYKHDKADTPFTRESARRFANDNWLDFLSNAHEGLGRLLAKLAELPAPVSAPLHRRGWRTDSDHRMPIAQPDLQPGIA